MKGKRCSLYFVFLAMISVGTFASFDDAHAGPSLVTAAQIQAVRAYLMNLVPALETAGTATEVAGAVSGLVADLSNVGNVQRLTDGLALSGKLLDLAILVSELNRVLDKDSVSGLTPAEHLQCRIEGAEVLLGYAASLSPTSLILEQSPVNVLGLLNGMDLVNPVGAVYDLQFGVLREVAPEILDILSYYENVLWPELFDAIDNRNFNRDPLGSLTFKWNQECSPFYPGTLGAPNSTHLIEESNISLYGFKIRFVKPYMAYAEQLREGKMLRVWIPSGFYVPQVKTVGPFGLFGKPNVRVAVKVACYDVATGNNISFLPEKVPVDRVVSEKRLYYLTDNAYVDIPSLGGSFLGLRITYSAFCEENDSPLWEHTEDLPLAQNLDTVPPEAQLHVSDSYPGSGVVSVRWNARDGGNIVESGVWAYDLWWKEDLGPWHGWYTRTTQTVAEFQVPEPGHQYYFRLIAVDRFGNRSTEVVCGSGPESNPVQNPEQIPQPPVPECRVFGGYVLPSALETLGEVAYRTYWRHPLGKMPDKAVLWRRIGSSPSAFEGFNIEPAVGNGADGSAFERRLKAFAADGWENQFYFEFTCEGQTYRDPEQGCYSGPAVARRDDFAVTGMKLDPTNPLGGQNATVIVSFANVGTVARAGAQVSLFVDGQQIGQSYGTSYYLFAGSSDEAAFTWAIPLIDEEKTYMIEGRVSFPGDGNASNNTLSQQIAIGPPPGAISGYVEDEYANACPGVTVRVTSGPSLATAETNDQGFYTLGNLKPGNYTLLAEKEFLKQSRNVVLHAGDDLENVNFQLSALDLQCVYAANSDGIHHERVKQIAWSRDGSKLVFHTLRDSFDEIYVMNCDGSNLTRVAGEGRPIFAGYSPSCSNVSDRFAFSGVYHDASNNTLFALVVYSFSNLTEPERIIPQVPSHSPSSWYPGQDDILLGSVKYHPQGPGDTIRYRYATGTDSICIEGICVTQEDTLAVSPDGRRLLVRDDLYDAQTFALLEENALFPMGDGACWLPDSSGVVMVRDHDLVIRRFDQQFDYVIAPTHDVEAYPALSPDGHILAFASSRGTSVDLGSRSLWLAPFDSQKAIVADLTTSPENMFSPNSDGVDDKLSCSFYLARQAQVTVRVLNSNGHHVATLKDKEPSDSGICAFEWNGTDSLGLLCPSQCYIITVDALTTSGESAYPLQCRIGINNGFTAWGPGISGWASPDFTEVAYLKPVGDTRQLLARDLETGEDLFLLGDASVIDQQQTMSWRPDGNALAVCAFDYGNPVYHNPQVAILDRAMSALVLLTHDERGPGASFPRFMKGIWPAYSPDGSQIAFIGTWQADPETELDDLYVINADGTNLQRITSMTTADTLQHAPAWTRDGTSILVTKIDRSTVNGDVFKVNLADGSLTRLTFSPQGDFIPVVTMDTFQFLCNSQRASTLGWADTWVQYLDLSQSLCLVPKFTAYGVSDDGFRLTNLSGYISLETSISKGSLNGRVLEMKGDEASGLSGVSALVVSADNIIGVGVTNQAGYFGIHNVDPGTYTLRFEKQGYRPEEIAEITISPNKTSASNDVTLARLPEVVLTEPNVNEKRYRDTLALGVVEVTHDVGAVRYEVAGIAKDNWTVLGTSSVAPFNWPLDSLGVADGTEQVFRIRAIAINASQEEDDAPSILTVVVDKKAPVPALALPATGTEFASQGPITLQATCEDTDVDNIVFQYRLGGEEQWHNAGVASSSPYVMLWTPLDPLVGSQYEVRAVAFDTAGNPGVSGTSTVTVDVTPPNPPVVTGAALTNNPRPTWSWGSGGGGNGTFRYQLDHITGDWTETTDLQFTPVEELSSGPHVLFVQERDAAGNWSADSFFDIFVDVTPPNAPNVTGTTPTNDTTPTWSWTPGGGGGAGAYRYQLDGSSGTWTETTGTTWTPGTALTAGAHTLYVQERDAAGNWSSSGSLAITVDTTAPSAPVVTGTTPTNDTTPAWSWSSGGGGGNGTYRYQLDSEAGTWITTTATTWTPGTALTAGAHTLYVKERDAAGNWSASGGFAITVSAAPKTIYVDAANTSGIEDGSGVNPWNTISEAVTETLAGRGDTINVRAGTYEEAVTLKPGTTVLSESGSYDTWITNPVGPPTLVTADNDCVVRGFTLVTDPAGTAVVALDSASVEVTNCVMPQGGVGILANPNTTIIAENNTFTGLGAAGVEVSATASLSKIKNNIFAESPVGIRIAAGGVVTEEGYNDFFSVDLPIDGATPAGTDLNVAPLFVDAANANFHLQAASGCRNAGDLAPQYDDIDGSANDLGADGGPHGVQDTTLPLPVIVTTPDPPTGTAPLSVTFDGSLSTDEWGIQAYSWDYDAADGIQQDATGPMATTTCHQGGTFTTTLTVTDNSGLENTVTADVVVEAPPSVTASVDPMAGPVPLTVQFTAEAMDPDGGSIVSYVWSFGDGIGTSNEQNPAYTYPTGLASGAYAATVTVTDDEGAFTVARAPLTLTDDVVDAAGLIDPFAGGTVVVTDGASPVAGIAVVAPPNALTQPTVLAVGPLTNPPPLPADGFGAMAHLNPTGIVFAAPVTIDLPHPAATPHPATIQVFYYDPAASLWSTTGISNVQHIDATPDHVVRFNTTHFTAFTAGGEGEGFLQVYLEPEDARSQGAQWRVDGGAWQESGSTITLSVGQHTVSFKDIEGDAGGCFKPATPWTKPAEQAVTIVVGQTARVTGTYTSSEKAQSAGVSKNGGTGNLMLLCLVTISLAYPGRRKNRRPFVNL